MKTSKTIAIYILLLFSFLQAQQGKYDRKSISSLGKIWHEGKLKNLDETYEKYVNDESWVKLSTNFTGRRHAAVVRNDDWVYVIGGYDGTTVFNIVEKCKPY